jgi:hypothetical protein
MNRVRLVAAATAWLAASLASPSSAQDTAPAPGLTLLPADARRWDASAHVTWLGQHLPDSFSWDRWYQVAAGGASVGYYYTPHLKAEFDIGTSTRGESYSIEPVPAPPGPIPPATVFPFLQRDHEFRVAAASAGLSAQFFENTWFHPFLSGGVEVVRERERINVTIPFVPPRDPRAPPVPPPSTETNVRYDVRPFAGAGFKVYLSERTFIRSDLRASWSADGVAGLAWRNGVGVDF